MVHSSVCTEECRLTLIPSLTLLVKALIAWLVLVSCETEQHSIESHVGEHRAERNKILHFAEATDQISYLVEIACNFLLCLDL